MHIHPKSRKIAGKFRDKAQAIKELLRHYQFGHEWK
jgi:hypothetical protein